MAIEQQKVEVPARPAPVSFAPARTAVIVVDMQNDFASSGGMFDRAGVDIGCVQAIVGNVAAVLDAARRAGLTLVFLKMGFGPDLEDAGFPSGPTWLKHMPLHVGDNVTAPDGSPSRILVRDCWNTDVIDKLVPEPGDVVMYKTRYSGFYNTDLDDVLRARDVDWRARARVMAGLRRWCAKNRAAGSRRTSRGP